MNVAVIITEVRFIMDKKKKEDVLDDLKIKASTPCECTGLLASGYGTEEELEEYNEVYNFIQEPIVNEEEN